MPEPLPAISSIWFESFFHYTREPRAAAAVYEAFHAVFNTDVSDNTLSWIASDIWPQILSDIIEVLPKAKSGVGVGRWLVTKGPLPLFQVALLRAGSVNAAYDVLAEKINARVDLQGRIVCRKMLFGRCRIEMPVLEGCTGQWLEDCLRGMLATVPVLFGRRPAKCTRVLKEDDDGQHVLIHVNWSNWTYDAMRSTVTGVILACGWYLAMHLFYDPDIAWHIWGMWMGPPIVMAWMGFYRGRSQVLYARWQFDQARIQKQIDEMSEYHHELKDKAETLQILQRSLEDHRKRALRRSTERQEELKQINDKLRKTQEQLIHAEKLSAVGQLAGGVAHEFNNILAPVQGYVELAKPRARIESTKLALDAVLNSCERAKKIVQGMLSFSRKNTPAFVRVNLVTLLQSALDLSRQDFENRDIMIVRRFGEVPAIVGDPGQLQQVILEFLLNAANAMKESRQKRLEVFLYRAQKHIHIAIRDTGCGIPEDNLSRIFEPFFTTNSQAYEAAKSTGLGLSVAQGIILNHQGTIKVSSEMGSGTVFTLVLPLHDPDLESRIKKKEGKDTHEFAVPNEMAGRMRPKILLIEHQDMIREMISEILEFAGYRVTAVSKGHDAVQILKQEYFQVAIADVLVPDMSLAKVISGVKRLRKNIPVIVMADSANEEFANVMAEMREEEGISFLRKPFRHRDLLMIVEGILKRTVSQDAEDEF